jgi:hypothetical protein
MEGPSEQGWDLSRKGRGCLVRDEAKDRIHDEFALTLDWAVLEYRTVGNELGLIKYPDYRCLEELARHSGRLHLVALGERPGVYQFTRQLELVYFPPRTPRNVDFEYRAVQWEGMIWALLSIPEKSRRFAERLAAKIGLRLADGVPTAFSSDDPSSPAFFPMRGNDVWTLEFAKGSTLPGLSGADEKRLVEDLERAFTARTPERQ